MRAVDANIIVRLIVRDDDRQVATATILVEQPFIVLPSVVLEMIWVLASVYALPRRTIVDEVIAIFRNPNAVLMAPDAVRLALAAYRTGGQFPDHLHIALAKEVGASSFATFDRKLRNRAAPELKLETLT
jgi:predicted nucleic-acid-binding protein